MDDQLDLFSNLQDAPECVPAPVAAVAATLGGGDALDDQQCKEQLDSVPKEWLAAVAEDAFSGRKEAFKALCKDEEAFGAVMRALRVVAVFKRNAYEKALQGHKGDDQASGWIVHADQRLREGVATLSHHLVAINDIPMASPPSYR